MTKLADASDKLATLNSFYPETAEEFLQEENKVFQAQQMKKDTAEAHDGVEDADVMYQFKNMTCYYVDNVSEK